jgi:hypothetical protein
MDVQLADQPRAAQALNSTLTLKVTRHAAPTLATEKARTGASG